jgi:hypothetical protein
VSEAGVTGIQSDELSSRSRDAEATKGLPTVFSDFGHKAQPRPSGENWQGIPQFSQSVEDHNGHQLNVFSYPLVQ